jgi:hypothetical protein
MVVGERLPRCTDHVQGVALGPAAPQGPLGPADLHHPLAVGLQEYGKPGAVAAGTLHRPATPTGHLRPGEVEQPTVTGRIGTDRGLGEQAAHRVGDGGGQGVAVGVDADHPVDDAAQPAHRNGSSVVAWSCRPGGHRAALL